MYKIKKKKHKNNSAPSTRNVPSNLPMEDLSKLERIPTTYQELNDYYVRLKQANTFILRKETFLRIERITERPLICYVAKTNNLSPGIPAQIDNSDLTGFSDLIQTVNGEAVDVFIVSNGGSAEASERIVRLLRERFKNVRFIVPANAYSAATLICFSGDEIVMDSIATLGPIDPQIDGVPARAILRAFETIEKRLKDEGPRALTAYMPLLSKYDLHILEICKSAQNLSEELARNWLSTYMLKCDLQSSLVTSTVEFFLNYDVHKSHGRSIDRAKARELGLKVIDVEAIKKEMDTGAANEVAPLVRSLYNQYELFFDRTPFFKVFENAQGISWGRQAQNVTFQLPLAVPPGIGRPVPQPGPPSPSG